MRRLGESRRSSRPDRWLLVEALLGLGLARAAILVLPFRWIAPLLGKPRTESPLSESDTKRDLALRVSRALGSASRHLPWRCGCLEQAVAAKWMLRRRNVPSTLYLGLARREGAYKAHAWVRAGDLILTGQPGGMGFSVVSTFAEEEE